MPITHGRSIGLYGSTGSGKTTLAGELAVERAKEGKKTLLHSSDMGGYESLLPHIELGIIEPHDLEEKDDPWIWVADAANGVGLTDEHGLVIFDGGSSMSQAIMSFITKSNWQVGQQKTQKFKVTQGNRSMEVGLNNEAHYGLVQGFMLDQIWRSTWLTRRGVDVLWTFGEWRGEDAKDAPIIGPLLVGKALTPKIPQWLKYFFRLETLAVDGQPARHVLHLQAKPEMAGTGMSLANARYALQATTTLPASIEPASLVAALDAIRKGKDEAKAAIASQLNLT